MNDYVLHPTELHDQAPGDYRDHAFTYLAFTHLVKWAIITAAAMMGAIYCYAIIDQPLIGTAVLFAGVAILAFGVGTLGRAARRTLGEPLVRPMRRTPHDVGA